MPLSPAVIPELRRLLGPDGLVVTPEGRMTYECDMHTFYKGTPELVALPRTTAQVVELVRLCRRERVAVIPDRKSTRLNSSHQIISYAVFCLKKKKKTLL